MRHAKQKVKKNWSKHIQRGYKKPVVYTVFVIVFMAKTALYRAIGDICAAYS